MNFTNFFVQNGKPPNMGLLSTMPKYDTKLNTNGLCFTTPIYGMNLSMWIVGHNTYKLYSYASVHACGAHQQ